MRAEAMGEPADPGLVVVAPLPLNARAARWGADPARVVHSGMGARASRRAAARALRVPGSAVAVTGVCVAIDPDLQTGDSVRHGSLGEGVVTRIEPGGLVTVRFANDASERKLMLEYAPLEKI